MGTAIVGPSRGRRRRWRAVVDLAVAVALIATLAGPAHAGVGNWTTQGPPGGEVKALVADPTAPQVLYAGTGPEIGGSTAFDAGIFRSFDGGDSWARVFRAADNAGVSSLAVAPVSGHVYAGLVDGRVVRSTDDGATWADYGTALPAEPVTALAVHPEDAFIFAGTSEGTLLQHPVADGPAAAWADITGTLAAELGTGDVHALASGRTAVGSNLRLYAATTVGLYSRAGSTTEWVRVDPLDTPAVPAVTARALALDPDDAATLFVGADVPSTTTGDGVHRSSNSGADWTQIVGDPSAITNPRSLGFDPAGDGTLYVGTLAFFFRVDNALTATTATNAAAGLPSGSLDVRGVALVPATGGAPAVVHAGLARRGLYRSANQAAAWERGTLGASQVNAVAAAGAPAGTVFAGVAIGGVEESDDAGATWASAPFGSPFNEIISLAIHPGDPDLVLAGSNVAILRRTGPTDQFVAVLDAGSGLGAPGSIRDLDIHPGDGDRLAVAYAATALGVVRSVAAPGVTLGDLGTWQVVGGNLPVSSVFSVAVDPSDPDVVYASAIATDFIRIADGTATEVTSPGSFADDIAVTRDGTVFAAGAFGLARSVDGGQSWTPLAGGLPAGPVPAIVVDPLVRDRLFALAYGRGVFLSADDGDTWTQVGDDLPVFDLLSLALSTTNPQIVHVGTGGGGAFDFVLPAVPDGDGDGILDPNDDCPGVAGVAPDGCPPPDGDGDGVPDATDACPAVAGTQPDGCPPATPPADSDGDGVPDSADACPSAFGTAPNGCPVVTPPPADPAPAPPSDPGAGTPAAPSAPPAPAALACTLPTRASTLSLATTVGQIRINQRIAIAAIRRLNSIAARLDGRPEPVVENKPAGEIRATTTQLRINQRISEAGYLRARTIYLRLGGTGSTALRAIASTLTLTRAGVGANQLTNIRALDMLNCINRNLG